MGFYNPDGGDCYDSAGTGVVAGDELTDKVWNYFVTANIPGVSDNAAVIAGIMGNLQAESGFRPFAVGSGGYYGIFQCSLESCAGASEMVGAVNASGGSSYWGTDGAPDAIINKALKIELDFLSKYGRFETSEVGFIPNLDVPSQKTPEAYAELFLVAVEGAINGEPLEDGGVLNFAQSKYGYSTYQAASARRTFARQIYDKYGSKTGSYRKTSSGYNKYDKNGSKTGSYRKTSNGYNAYDKYGRKTGSYKTGSNGVTTKYDQYGRKSGSFKKDSSGRVTEYDKYGRKVGSYK
jgi:hypothetical protein